MKEIILKETPKDVMHIDEFIDIIDEDTVIYNIEKGGDEFIITRSDGKDVNFWSIIALKDMKVYCTYEDDEDLIDFIKNASEYHDDKFYFYENYEEFKKSR
jgi:hypothetical protein